MRKERRCASHHSHSASISIRANNSSLGGTLHSAASTLPGRRSRRRCITSAFTHGLPLLLLLALTAATHKPRSQQPADEQRNEYTCRYEASNQRWIAAAAATATAIRVACCSAAASAAATSTGRLSTVDGAAASNPRAIDKLQRVDACSKRRRVSGARWEHSLSTSGARGRRRGRAGRGAGREGNG